MKSHNFQVGDLVIRKTTFSNKSYFYQEYGEGPYKITSYNHSYIRFKGAQSGWHHSGFTLYKKSLKLEDVV